MKCCQIALGILGLGITILSAEQILHVYPTGSALVGEKGFRDLSAAVRSATPGDQIWLHGGVYRESWTVDSSGTTNGPLKIRNAPGELVIIDGRDPISGVSEEISPGLWRIPFAGEVKQLFWNDTPMLLARWPNTTFDRLLTRDGWSAVDEFSSYGKIKDRKLPATGVDYTGMEIVLNVCHQFFTWSRKVTKHNAEYQVLLYPQDLGKAMETMKDWPRWHDDYYYLQGRLDLLDAPGEYVQEEGYLYFRLPSGASPSGGRLYVKTRDYALSFESASGVAMKGIRFFATAICADKVRNLWISDCHFDYPSFASVPPEWNPEKEKVVNAVAGIKLSGDHIRFSWSSIRNSYTSGLILSGGDNWVQNVLVENVNWHGDLLDSGIKVSGTNKEMPNKVEFSTVHEFGAVGIQVNGAPAVIRQNHVYNGGALSHDVSLIYGRTPAIDGTIIEQNWVHDCLGERFGIGIRGDDQTRGMHLRNNIVWGCNDVGIEIKGDLNSVTGNLIFGTGLAGILYDCTPEPEKAWVKMYPVIDKQNANSVLKDNVTDGIIGLRGRPYYGDLSGEVDNNFIFDDAWLANQAGGGVHEAIERLSLQMVEEQRTLLPRDPGYRNGVIIMKNEDGYLQVRLRMPVSEAHSLFVELRNASGNIYAQELSFSPDNWQSYQTVPIVYDAQAARIYTPAWGEVIATEIEGETTLSFTRSQ